MDVVISVLIGLCCVAFALACTSLAVRWIISSIVLAMLCCVGLFFLDRQPAVEVSRGTTISDRLRVGSIDVKFSGPRRVTEIVESRPWFFRSTSRWEVE